MNSGVVADVERSSPREGAPEIAYGEVIRRGGIESWLHDHLDAFAAAVIAAAFAVRVFGAARDYLNPDEAIHYVLLNQPSALLAYKASLTNAHPPLIYLLVYFWHFLGRSEWMIRLPSVIAGTAFCWFTYKWLETVFGKAAGLIGLILAAFLPPLISLSTQLREYALLVFCISGALYSLERAFQEKSAGAMAYFSAFLSLAILTHYSAALFVLAIGVYAVTRISDSQLPRKVTAAWAGGQAGALAIYLFLYLTHVSKIQNSVTLWAAPFDQSYFYSDREDIFTFTARQTLQIFEFLFEQRYLYPAMLLCFAAGGVFLIVRDLGSRRAGVGSRHSAILLSLPFIAAWGAAIAGKYPYVGSRHTVFLASFAIAGVSFLLAAICRHKLWAGILIAILCVGIANASGKTNGEPFITRENRRRTLMTLAVNFMRQSIPRSDLILTDYQAGFPLEYYFCGPRQMIPMETVRGDFFKVECNGYSIVFPAIWKLSAGNFALQFQKMAKAYGLKPGDRVWIFQSGWGDNLDKALPSFFRKFRCLDSKSFGNNLTVIPFTADPELLPATTLSDCSD